MIPPCKIQAVHIERILQGGGGGTAVTCVLEQEGQNIYEDHLGQNGVVSAMTAMVEAFGARQQSLHMHSTGFSHIYLRDVVVAAFQVTSR